MNNILSLTRVVILFTCCYIMTPTLLFSQTLEAAYSAMDFQFDEFRVHINQEEYVEAIKQFGSNPYRRWNFRFENLDGEYYSGYMQQKWEGDVNYWDLQFDNEWLSITTVYSNDVFTWKITHDDRYFIIQAKDRFGTEWEDRAEKDFDWTMYQVEEGELRDWYIDENAEGNLSFPMRLAAIMIVLEISTAQY